MCGLPVAWAGAIWEIPVKGASSAMATPTPSDVALNPVGVSPSQRLLSLDALRGFDMLWIIGGEVIGTAIAGLQGLEGGGFGRMLTTQLDHAEWEGFHFYDLIFPTFVFIMGIALTFSLNRLIATEGRAGALKRVFRRSLLMYLLGLFYYGGFSTPLAQIRLLGVLQRLALCYFFASLLFIYLRPKGLMAAFVSLLVGYWALLTFVPVPGFGAGDFAEGHNLTNWLDKRFLPLRKWDGDHDPEGILSTLPAIGTCLLGVFTGLLVRDEKRSEKQKAALLAGAGIAAIILGELWGLQFPVIKKIWTSSYVLVAGGWSLLLFAACYSIIEVWKLRAWATPFVWIGTNAITIYLITDIADFGNLSTRLIGGPIEEWLNGLWRGLGGLVVATMYVLLCLLVCRFLYRRKIFLRL
jgi:predicted acyltransferase